MAIDVLNTDDTVSRPLFDGENIYLPCLRGSVGRHRQVLSVVISNPADMFEAAMIIRWSGLAPSGLPEGYTNGEINGLSWQELVSMAYI